MVRSAFKKPGRRTVSPLLPVVIAFLAAPATRHLHAQDTSLVGGLPVGWELSDLALPIRWQSSEEVAIGTGLHRQAILVSADRTQNRPSWTIKFASANMKAFGEALARRGGIAHANMTELTGDAVNASAIEAAIYDAARRFDGRENLLILYFTGHGYVDASGAPVFFTYFTRESRGGFQGVVHRNQIHEWLARAKALARQRGVEFQAVLIVDACRIRIMAPPPPASITPSADWEWYGVEEGQFAEAPVEDQPSPFTAAVIEAMERLANLGEATLEQTFELSRRLTIARTSGRQRPELLRVLQAQQSPVLVQPSRVAIAVQVVDAVSGLGLPRAVVNIGPSVVSDSRLIHLTPGRHLLHVRADGYLARSEEIELSPEHTGRALEIPLHPSLLLVRGRVTPRRIVVLRWRGQRTSGSYFVTETTSGLDGTFTLRLPATASGTAIDVSEAGRIVRTVALPDRPSQFVRPPGASYEGIPVLDLSTIALSTTGSSTDELYRVATNSFSTRVPMPIGISDHALREPPQLRNAIAREQLDAVSRYAQASRWELARANLLELITTESASEPAGQRSLVQLLGWVVAQEAVNIDDLDSIERLATDFGSRYAPVEDAVRAILLQRVVEEIEVLASRTPTAVLDSVLDALSGLRLALQHSWAESRCLVARKAADLPHR